MKKQRRHRCRAPTPVHVPAAELTFLVFETASARDGDSCAGLIGDVNIFLISRAHAAGYLATGAGRAAPAEGEELADVHGVAAEIMVMIAEPTARRRGFAVEAVAAMLRFCASPRRRLRKACARERVRGRG